jgi:hypothetical protein
MSDLPERIWACMGGPMVGMFVSGGNNGGWPEYVRAGNDLTAERDRLAAAVDAVMADRKRILEERDRGFVMVMERAERAEAEVARLTALLPHPGETAAEVMWRNYQRGVRYEELAKAAGVTRERARQMVRKAEMRMGGA